MTYYCDCTYCKRYDLKENNMVTDDTRPCGNKNCWCQVDKVEPPATVIPTGADFTITATDKYPMSIEWDKYGNVTIKDQPLGGFEKPVKPPLDPKKDPFNWENDKVPTGLAPEPKSMFDMPSGKPLAAFFWDDRNIPDWDFDKGRKDWATEELRERATEETRERDPLTGGEKGKKLAELGAIDPDSLMELAKVAGYGSGKYSRLNYMKGYKWSLSYDAMQRHLLLFWGGESIDPESGLHHLAHAAWHCMTLLSYDERELGTDDRYEADW